MANLGYVSTFNINGNELTLKDAALTEIVSEIIEAIGANNTNIAERINDLHNRSFDNTIKISSQNESEIASIQDGLYKIQYVTVTGEGDNATETLNDSAILIQKGNNQYLYKDGSLHSRTKTNNTWGTWTTFEGGVTSVNGMTGAVTIDTGVTSFNGATGAITYTAPVTSVNNQTGAVTLALGDTNVIETVKVNNTALTPDANKAVNIDLSSYDEVPLIIEINSTDTTVPSGTYTNIRNALTNDREVYIKMNKDHYSVCYLKLCEGLSRGREQYYIFCSDGIRVSIWSNNTLSIEFDIYAESWHNHGDIDNDGTLNDSQPISIANGDRIVITDASSNEKIQKTSITFDGSTTTTALTPKGTWETFLKTAPVTSVNNQTGAVTVKENVQSDWNATTGDAVILNKPTIPAAVTESTVAGWGFTKNTGTLTAETQLSKGTATGTGNAVTDINVSNHQITLVKGKTFLETAPVTSVNGATGAVTVKANVQSDWNATSGDAVILNKPTIPTVNNSTVTITMNGNTVGTFTLNKSGNTTIDLGTVLTSHQSIKTINNQTITGTGNVDISGLPTVTSADNGKVLMVVNGAWQLVSPVTLYSGSGTPANSQGNNGDLYIQS